MNYVIQPGDTPEQNGIPRSFWWTMNDTTNEMLLRVYRSLDFETTPRYTLTIKAAVSTSKIPPSTDNQCHGQEIFLDQNTTSKDRLP